MEYKECKGRGNEEREREKRNNVFQRQHALSLADSSRFQLARNYTSIVRAEELTRFACVASSPLCFYGMFPPRFPVICHGVVTPSFTMC